ncbi:MAG: hypothetical protein J6S85_26555 [Methanobrevibacter sp.]|nr:hypothetical protein [Methanobrevibacter sp.]MBO7717156.1 hypothetical protein [Methanobrevibacter sp.]
MANVMQTLSDLAALARAGLKGDELKEIIALTKEDSTPAQGAPEIAQKDETQPEAQTDKDTETPKEELNYKKMFEDTTKELEALKADLAKAQQANVSKDVSNNNTAPKGQDAVNAIFRNIIN